MTLFSQTGWRFWWLILLLLIADQVTKQVVIHNMQLFDSISVVPFFNITYVRNYGAAFSFLSDAGGWQRWFFTLIAVGVSIVIAVWLAKLPRQQVKLSLALSLVLAGAIGNLVDRSIYGYVIDFLHVFYQDWHYPAFNVADSAICIGAVLLIWDSFTNKAEAKHD
ncbi:signal peptidase II [Rheinheimera sp. MMS21-TC3]|uniref:signal peptidase II n=1 Tax=Rheinheimera sp. MMS21-TC3 TaxID=3072790 RepID=UPI0028C44211|nr:signal peptidase II [Rheinheimera sp. MMS21-TC3]WNO59988.1 signal peptidase II [Rheinheimera sp. MMS21-TC3]